MPKKNSRLSHLLGNPAVVTLAVCLLVLACNIAVVGRTRPFNSDDLYWQQVVRTWKPFSGHTLYFGTKDTFVEESPFFALMEHSFSPSRKLLIAESEILTLSAFTLFYVSALYFLKKLRLKPSYLGLLPFIWLSSFGYSLVQNYLNSDWRTFELGFSFLTFALVAATTLGEFKPMRSLWTKLVAAIGVIFTGVLIYSDPYYLFFTIGPLLLFIGALFLLKKISRVQLLAIFGAGALSMVFAKLTELFFTKAGAVTVTDTPSAFIGFDNIVTNIVASLHGLLIVFGADFFGRPTASLISIGSAINAAVLLIIGYRIWSLRVTLKHSVAEHLSLPQLWLTFFAGLSAFVFLIYTLSTLVTVTNYRYFLMLIYASIIILAFLLSSLKGTYIKLTMSCLLVAATAFNLWYTVLGDSIATQGDVTGNARNSLNFEIIDKVASQSLTKGYGSYWHGNVNTYLSGGRIIFLPTLCLPEGKTVPFKWLLDGDLYNHSAQSSFYIVDPDLFQPPTCSEQQLIDQFGTPENILHVRDKTILVFSYDIGTKMQ